ncbi:hypothetical protein ACS0TY_032374 [Phlomoides rotata]
MTLNLCVLAPNRIVWDSEVKEIILSTNSGQIGVLANHAPVVTTVDIWILRIRLTDQWLMMALMGGFARIGNKLISWRGYWQELIETLAWAHERTPLANLIRWRDKLVALSIVQARLVGLAHFSVGYIFTYAAFLIASTSGKFG